MAVCSLCGNEEVEKPRVIHRIIRTDSPYIKDNIDFVVPFGSYCWKKNRSGCVAKANELWCMEIMDRGLERFN